MNNKNINSGDNSNNLQAKQVVINNYNTSKHDIRESVIEVFKESMPQLTALAQKKILERVEELVESILNAAIKKGANLENLQEPGIQLALFEAQKGYAKSGDGKLLEILTELFVERLKIKENSLNNIVLDEAVRIAPKLTVSHLNVLALIFRLKYIRNEGLTSYKDVRWFVENKLMPIAINIPKNDLQFKHLAYTGVVLMSNGIRSGKGLTGEVFEMYNGALQKGFKKSEIPEKLQEACSAICINKDERDDVLQFKGQSLRIIENELLSKGFTPSLSTEVRNYLYGTIMSQQELGIKLRKDVPHYEEIFNNWDIIDYQNITLSSVGAALAESFLIINNIETEKIIDRQLLAK